MNISYICPYWGCEKDNAYAFISKVLDAKYKGIEIDLPESKTFNDNFFAGLENVRSSNPNFTFIAQQLSSPENKSIDAYIEKMKKQLIELAAYKPDFINSHTGKDYFSFDDNCRVIEAALNISKKMSIRILHETHRGRFSFHAAGLIPYLQKFPELELVGDFSHFCTVSESLLQDQEEIIQQIIPHVSHIHARVGHEQSPQVNNPIAPEWQNHLNRFMGWWNEIITPKKEQGWKSFTITPEFGPTPYMPLVPFSQEPISNQWECNIFIMNKMKQML